MLYVKDNPRYSMINIYKRKFQFLVKYVNFGNKKVGFLKLSIRNYFFISNLI